MEELIVELELLLEKLHLKQDHDEDYYSGLYDLAHFVKHGSTDGITRLINEVNKEMEKSTE